MKKFLKRILLALGGLLFGILLAEGLARLLLPEPVKQIKLLRMRAPDLQMDAGTDLKNPNYNPFLQRNPFSEWVCDGKIPEKMNNEGFRDRDFVKEKTPGRTRIAILGDSFTEGWMGPREAAFPRLLETDLGTGYEILNFGLANRSPLRYLALYAQIVRKYHPDIVIVCLYSNDVKEDDDLKSYVQFDAYGVPSHFDYERYFRHTPRMPQTKWEKRKDRWQWFFCQHSRLFPYISVAFTVDPEFRHRILDAAPAASFDALWVNTEGYLRTLREIVEGDGSKIILAYAPDLGDFNNPNPLLSHTKTFADEQKILCYDASDFLKTTNSASLYIPGDGHFSPEGHRRFENGLAHSLMPLLRPAVTNAPPAKM